jgi:SAM-dependent methyltransferase
MSDDSRNKLVSEEGISTLTDPSMHDLVVARLGRDFGPRAAGARLLDAPCGAGALSVRMRKLGFDVACCDIDPGNFEAQGFEVRQGDLNQRVPFDDASLDVVMSIAGLQRLSNPDQAVGEFHRILKPGGTLYLGVPNFATLRRRLHFLFYGSLGHRFDDPKYRQTVSNPAANFRFPIGYPRVERMLTDAGFSVKDVEHDGKGVGVFLCLPLSLLIRLLGWMKARSNAPKYAGYDRGNRFGMLRGQSYLIVAKKPG